jgi:hypothetical protein
MMSATFTRFPWHAKPSFDCGFLTSILHQSTQSPAWNPLPPARNPSASIVRLCSTSTAFTSTSVALGFLFCVWVQFGLKRGFPPLSLTFYPTTITCSANGYIMPANPLKSVDSFTAWTGCVGFHLHDEPRLDIPLLYVCENHPRTTNFDFFDLQGYQLFHWSARFLFLGFSLNGN